MKYRTYDRAWNRTGYADAPQYPGQQPVRDGVDFAPTCGTCGGGIVSVRRTVDAPGGYVARCAKGHRLELAAC